MPTMPPLPLLLPLSRLQLSPRLLRSLLPPLPLLSLLPLSWLQLSPRSLPPLLPGLPKLKYARAHPLTHSPTYPATHTRALLSSLSFFSPCSLSFSSVPLPASVCVSSSPSHLLDALVGVNCPPVLGCLGRLSLMTWTRWLAAANCCSLLLAAGCCSLLIAAAACCCPPLLLAAVGCRCWLLPHYCWLPPCCC